MIGYLNGKLAVKDPTYVIADVNGVGYEVKISLNTFSKIKDLDTCLLHTYLHVKEDSQTLYGFSNPEEKIIFLHLISISGVGPNTALMINSSLSVEEIRNAIISENVAVIRKVKGIGTKTAQRIILELKDKFFLGHNQSLIYDYKKNLNEFKEAIKEQEDKGCSIVSFVSDNVKEIQTALATGNFAGKGKTLTYIHRGNNKAEDGLYYHEYQPEKGYIISSFEDLKMVSKILMRVWRWAS